MTNETTGRYAPMPEQCAAALVQNFQGQGEYRTLSTEYSEHDPKYSERQMRAYADATCALRDAQRPADSWRDAVEHELTVLHLSCPDDPKKAIQDLISWNCKIALDPAVSSDARALVERGRQEAQRPADLNGLTATGVVSQNSGDMSSKAAQDDRAAFEAWFRDYLGPLTTNVEKSAMYRAWQAALASRPVPPPISDDEILNKAHDAGLGFGVMDPAWAVQVGLPVGSRYTSTSIFDTEFCLFVRAIIAARDAQWKGDV